MKNSPSRNYLEALRQLRIFTNGTYDIWSLAGPRNTAARVAIMSAIQGFKTPQAKAGVNALIATFHDASGVFGDTPRNRDIAFAEWAKHHGDDLDI